MSKDKVERLKALLSDLLADAANDRVNDSDVSNFVDLLLEVVEVKE